MNKKFALFFISIFISLLISPVALAQSNVEVRAQIDSIELNEQTQEGIHIIFSASDSDGNTYLVDSSESLLDRVRYDLSEGQEVLLQTVEYEDGTSQVFLVDVIRTSSILWIALFFALVVIVVGKKRGISSLVGLAITFLILFGLIVPQIIQGTDPVLITIFGSAIILLVNLPLTHGFNKRTFYAYLSTLVGLSLAWIFSVVFVHLANLSGLGSEESSLLFLTTEAIKLPSGLLLAGIILGAVGVLDDIAITQTETVSELHQTNPNLTAKELYNKAMNVGRHHIASVVNTLVLAYAGVALPIFLLFSLRDDMGFMRLLNEEIIAEEVIRTLAGTTALILLVPISTWMATRIYKLKKSKEN
jgi:uncharacterized membrane protein